MDEALTVDQLAETLQEPNKPLLRQVLRVLGADRTTLLLTEALQLEAAGGLLTHDGTRRRTPGGTFFQLVRQQASPTERRRLFPRPAPQQDQLQPQTPPPVLTWDEVPTIIQTLATQSAGEARTMKVTLIGRPGKVETRQQCVVFGYPLKAGHQMPQWFQASKVVAASDGHSRRF